MPWPRRPDREESSCPCSPDWSIVLLIGSQTLGTLSKNFHQPHFEKLLCRLAGLVYLGTPHPTFDKPQEWSRLSHLLKACTKLSWKAIERSAAQISSTARISRLFDDAGFQLPVLSIYEGKPTKISSKFMGSKREVVSAMFLSQTLRDLTNKRVARGFELCTHRPEAGDFGQN